MAITIQKTDKVPAYENDAQIQACLRRESELMKGMSIHGELPAPGEKGLIKVSVYRKPGEPDTAQYFVPVTRLARGSLQSISADVTRAKESAAYTIARYEAGLFSAAPEDDAK